jgi:hypothetical protein
MNHVQTSYILYTSFYILLILISIVCFSCFQDNHDPIPKDYLFYAVDISVLRSDGCHDSNQMYTYYPLQADLVREGTHCALYIEKGKDSYVNPSTFSEIQKYFDTQIYSQITDFFAPAPDVDTNGKIYFLFLDVKDGYGTNTSQFIRGYFDPMQLFEFDYGTKQDLYYLDVYPTDLSSDSALFIEKTIRTLVHEFTHMCIFNQRILLNHPELIPDRITDPMLNDTFIFESEFDLWIEEGLTKSAEHYFFNTPLSDLISRYNRDPGDYNCDLFPIHHFRDGWPLLSWWYSIYDYVLSYLFMQYLKIQAENPTTFFSDFIKNPKSGSEALLETCQTHQILDSNLNVSEGFRVLLGRFAVAMTLRLPDGIYGFKNQLFSNSTPLIRFTNQKSPIILYPGSWVLIQNSSNNSLNIDIESHSNLGILGLNAETNEIDWHGSDGFNDSIVILYNYDNNPAGTPIQIPLDSK